MTGRSHHASRSPDKISASHRGGNSEGLDRYPKCHLVPICASPTNAAKLKPSREKSSVTRAGHSYGCSSGPPGKGEASQTPLSSVQSGWTTYRKLTPRALPAGAAIAPFNAEIWIGPRSCVTRETQPGRKTPRPRMELRAVLAESMSSGQDAAGRHASDENLVRSNLTPAQEAAAITRRTLMASAFR